MAPLLYGGSRRCRSLTFWLQRHAKVAFGPREREHKMPFKTRYGSHYHMTEGCHGATIPCGTEGLTPCSDCCGGGAKVAKGQDGGSSIGAGSPVSGTGQHGPTRESMEAADRWRRGATNALFGGSIDPGSIKNGGRGMTYDEWKEQRDADAQLDAMMEAANSPDYDFDEMADDAFPFGDGGRYSLYGSSDHFPDDDNIDALYQAETSETLSETRLHAMRDGMGSPSDMTIDDMARALTDAQSEGRPYDEWDARTRKAAERAGIPTTAMSLGSSDGTYLFEVSSTSTRNPNDPNDHFGEWLYDVHDVKVVTGDGEDLTPTVHVARNLRESMGNATRRFDEQCEEEARRRAQEPVVARRTAEIDRAREEARQRYNSEVVSAWRAGYDAWRMEHDQQAQDIARSMRRDRPEWRHQYIPGDVEDRMRRQYERTNPRPANWSYALPEYQEATVAGAEEADRQLREEGYDIESETRRLAGEVRRERDPEGLHGVSKAMRANYDAAMGRLSRYPVAMELAMSDIPMTWGGTMGMPVSMPKAWKDRMSRG